LDITHTNLLSHHPAGMWARTIARSCLLPSTVLPVASTSRAVVTPARCVRHPCTSGLHCVTRFSTLLQHNNEIRIVPSLYARPSKPAQRRAVSRAFSFLSSVSYCTDRLPPPLAIFYRERNVTSTVRIAVAKRRLPPPSVPLVPAWAGLLSIASESILGIRYNRGVEMMEDTVVHLSGD
jgi:hypothetical protein